jgi:DNA protecting protein DprA
MSFIPSSSREFLLTPDSGRLPFLFEGDRPAERLRILARDEVALEALERLPERGLGVVGTRHPQPRSLREIRRVLAGLAGRDFVIVSGFARGIDAAAHEAALELGLPTVAVLGAGFAFNYPSANASLRRRIIDAGGLLVTEFTDEEGPIAHQFIRRNRLIAHWTRATWVVEAASRSGALNTAHWAQRAHRTVYSTPGYPDDPTLAGNQKLLDDDAAQAVWGCHSFGSTWLELAAPRVETTAARTASQPTTNIPARIEAEIQCRERMNGAVETLALLDWAKSVGVGGDAFFDALESLLQEGRIRKAGGLLLKNPESPL